MLKLKSLEVQDISLYLDMKKSVACIFAHPDDEAFGPGGTIAKFAKDYDVYILSATKGEAGGKDEVDLGHVREKELLKSARILGVKKVYFLGFLDGTLNNNQYHKLADKIKEKLDEIKPEILLTYEPRGVSGHIDHIAVSMVCSYLFEKLKYPKTILYFCHIDWQIKIIRRFLKNYFVYFPPGYKKSEIGLTVDIGPFWQIKVDAMKIHASQKSDLKKILTFLQFMPKKEHFLVWKK